VTRAFLPKKIISTVCSSAQTLITLRKALLVFLFVVIHRHISFLVQLARLLLRHIELIIDFLAIIEQAPVTDLFKLPEDVPLSLELVHALLTHFLDGASGGLLLAPRLLFDRIERLPGLKSRTVEIVLRLLLLPLGHLH